MFTYKKFIVGLLCISLLKAESSLQDHIHNQFLNSIIETDAAVPAQTPDPMQELSWLDKMKNNLTYTIVKPIILSTTQKEIASIAFNKLITQQETTNNTILDISSLDKLHIFSCNGTRTSSLYNAIFGSDLSTIGGKAYAAIQLSNPSINLTPVLSKQNAIKSLTTNYDRSQFLAIFKQMSNYDKRLWVFWHKNPLIDKNFENSIYFSMLGFKRFNKSVIALETEKYLKYTYKTINAACLTMTPLIVTKLLTGCSWSQIPSEYIKTLKNFSSVTMDPSLKAATFYSTFITPILTPMVFYQEVIQFKNNELGMEVVHTTLNDVAATLTLFKKLGTILKNNPNLIEQMPDLKHIIDLFDPCKHSAQFNKLVALLNTNTFTSKPSFFSITGRVKVAYKLMQEVKDEFLPALHAAAQLETYSALAELYVNNQAGSVTHYCFADFSAEGPRIEATNFWNPLVDAAHVVRNSISLSPHNAQHVILTGPNTAGKTTIIKALAQAALLAQTFGIAPADVFTLSPFAKINCFMEINDDISTGTSLFKAEVKRAKQLLEQMKSLDNNQYIFTLMDEVFTSTSPKEGEAAAYMFTKQFGAFSNCLTILATHYPQLTELPKESNSFTNMQVEVIRHEDNSLERTFRLKDGPSFMNIAMDILQDEGVIQS